MKTIKIAGFTIKLKTLETNIAVSIFRNYEKTPISGTIKNNLMNAEIWAVREIAEKWS